MPWSRSGGRRRPARPRRWRGEAGRPPRLRGRRAARPPPALQPVAPRRGHRGRLGHPPHQPRRGRAPLRQPASSWPWAATCSSSIPGRTRPRAACRWRCPRRASSAWTTWTPCAAGCAAARHMAPLAWARPRPRPATSRARWRSAAPPRSSCRCARSACAWAATCPPGEDERGERVCVIGAKLQDELFLGENPLGRGAAPGRGALQGHRRDGAARGLARHRPRRGGPHPGGPGPAPLRPARALPDHGRAGLARGDRGGQERARSRCSRSATTASRTSRW